jgi:hypothetical protein
LAASPVEAVDSHGPLVPVASGSAYRVASAPDCALVTPGLAAELARVLERFARDAGFDSCHPVALHFKPGFIGHHRVGRAADIYAVGGLGLDVWRRCWEEAPRSGERVRNLGWRLYRALQCYGRWVQPPGYPIQLFGPWTRSEGPWRRISDSLLHAHRDHIHVAL